METQEETICRLVAQVERLLRPAVERIRYSIARDWTGEDSLFLRVVLSDDLETPAVHRTALQVHEQFRKLEKECDPSLGLPVYFNFRKLSECAQIGDPEWAAV